MRLDSGERTTLAEHLLLSVDEREDIDHEILEECRDRMAAFQRGEIEAISIEEVLARLDAEDVK